MFIDEGTLRDLDVFSVSSGATRRLPNRPVTIIELVDKTRSRAGRTALRRQLAGSETSAEDVVAYQEAHRALAASSHYYRGALDAANLDDVEQYLNTNWHIPAAGAGAFRSFAGWWSRGWWADYIEAVEAGRLRVRGLLSAASQLEARLSREHASRLRLIAGELGALLGSPGLAELARLAVRPGPSRLSFDQLAREGAKRELLEMVELIGRVEAHWSLGAATVENRWVYPEPGSRLRIEGLCHPLLGPGGVANDLDLNQDVRVCFVTGPNMAGKSTFLKAVSVALLLAHAGVGVPAASLEFPVFGAIFSSVRVAESLVAGESLYLAEVRRVRGLAEAIRCHGAVMAVLDEPLRGTNVHDAAEATLAVVTRLVGHPGSLVFVASHIGEVVPSIAGDHRIRLLQFSADTAGDEPRFDYRIRDGVSTQRLGMTLLRREGVLDLLEPATGEPRRFEAKLR